MSGIARTASGGVPVLGLVGEFGLERRDELASALDEVLRSTGGLVLLDLRGTVHLHYRLAGQLVSAARRRRLGLVGASPYVREIFRLAGSLEHEVSEYGDLGEALGEHAA